MDSFASPCRFRNHFDLLSGSRGRRWGERFFDGLKAGFEAKLKAEHEAKLKAGLEAELKAEHEARGKQQALLAFLQAREISLSPEQCQRIQECTDNDVLDHWIRRAATVSSTDEALELPPSPRKKAAKRARPASRRRASRA